MEPLLTVVTVSLNSAGTIDDALASVAMQEVDFDIEHVCVDGGSNDGTREIIDRWSQRCAHVRRIFEPDSGIFDAMNKGLRAARGEYLFFLNSDDFLTGPGALAAALQGLRPHVQSNPDLIVGDVCMGRLGTRGFWRHRRVPRLLGKLPGLFAVHQGEFVRRQLVEAVGGFDPRWRLASDVTLYYELERRFPLNVRRVRQDLTFMRAGGAANAGLRAMLLGSAEIFKHLAPVRGIARAASMVAVKTAQSFGELRFGKCPHARWFESAVSR